MTKRLKLEQEAFESELFNLLGARPEFKDHYAVVSSFPFPDHLAEYMDFNPENPPRVLRVEFEYARQLRAYELNMSPTRGAHFVTMMRSLVDRRSMQPLGEGKTPDNCMYVIELTGYTSETISRDAAREIFKAMIAEDFFFAGKTWLNMPQCAKKATDIHHSVSEALNPSRQLREKYLRAAYHMRELCYMGLVTTLAPGMDLSQAAANIDQMLGSWEERLTGFAAPSRK